MAAVAVAVETGTGVDAGDLSMMIATARLAVAPKKGAGDANVTTEREATATAIRIRAENAKTAMVGSVTKYGQRWNEPRCLTSPRRRPRMSHRRQSPLRRLLSDLSQAAPPLTPTQWSVAVASLRQRALGLSRSGPCRLGNQVEAINFRLLD